MKRWAPWALLSPGIVAVGLLLILPVVNTVGGTFLSESGWFAEYVRFAASALNRIVVWRTLEMAFLVTAISLLLGFPAAYFIAQASPRARALLIVASVFPLLTGSVVRSFAWLVILGRNGIVNSALLALGAATEPLPLIYTKGAVVIGLVYLFTPLMILSLVGVLEGIDRDLIAASSSLGAGPAATFRQVILPLSMPGLIVGSVLVFTGSFAAYVTPALLGGERQMMLGTLLYQRAMILFDWPGATTVASVMIAITVGVLVLMNRAAHRLNPATA